MRAKWAWLLAIWTGVIVYLVVPWHGFQDHAHWARVGWLPFLGPAVRAGDVVRNVLFYVPWGYLYARHRGPHSRLWTAAGFAFLLSALTEAAQVFSHGRFPSMTDVTCNVAGAMGGAVWAQRQMRRRNRVEPP